VAVEAYGVCGDDHALHYHGQSAQTKYWRCACGRKHKWERDGRYVTLEDREQGMISTYDRGLAEQVFHASGQ
jgi:hypothetical protein